MGVTLLTLALSLPAAPAPAPKLERPKGLPPRVVMITAARDGKFQLVDTTHDMVAVAKQLNVQIGQQVRKVTQTITEFRPRMVQRTLNVKDVRFYGLDGKKIENEEAAKLLTKDMPALVSADGKPVDRFYLRVAVRGTLVLVLPPETPTPPVAFPFGMQLPAMPVRKLSVEQKK